MRFLGQKRLKLYEEFISRYIPNNIETYVEPFAGSFAVACYLFEERFDDNNEPKKLIYNDINKYNLNIYADKVHHLDYKKIFEMYDSVNTFFYLDPPYFKKEFLYDGCKEYTKQFHIELRDILKNIKGKFLLSYEDNDFIRELYKDFNIINYDGNTSIFKRELLINI